MPNTYPVKHLSTTWLSPDTALFTLSKPLGYQYQAGQFCEWTIPHDNPDNRGVTRQFSFASSPTEDTLCFVSKFYDPGSTYKSTMKTMLPGYDMSISEPRGLFVLPEDSSVPVVFLAGGVGCAPFRGLVQYSLDTAQNRSLTFFYSNPGLSSIPLKDYFDTASAKISLKMVYSLTRENPPAWTGELGHFTPDMLQKYLVTSDRTLYYVCGPTLMVTSIVQTLRQLQIKPSQLRLDPFTGY